MQDTRDIIECFGCDADGAHLRALLLRLEGSREAIQVQLAEPAQEDSSQAELRAILSAYDATLGILPQLWKKVRDEHQR